MRVLVVDDDEELRELLLSALRRDGHTVVAVGSAEAARGLALSEQADVMVLDLALPDGTGVDLCRDLRRADVALPILMLTAHSEVARRIESLDAGVDDFLGKPFAVGELCARVRALARRRAVGLAVPSLKRGALELNFSARRAARDSEVLQLTGREWALLESLALRRGRVVARAELLIELWGDDSEATSASLDVLVARIRRKLEVDVLRTVRHQGYALELS